MAPPPSASLPLKERLLQLAQTLQFAWFIGHVVFLSCIGRYSLSYITFNFYTRWARYSYRTAFVAAGVTYGIVVYKALKAKSRGGSKAQQGYTSLIADENVQYLGMATVWLFSPQYPLALLPFGVYSVFHVATYTRTFLIPTIQPPTPIPGAAAASPSGKPAMKNSPIADRIGKFVKEYYDLSMGLVATLEIVLWVRILISAIVWTRGSWILFVVYTAFLRARFAQSSFVQNSFRTLTARIDGLVGGQGNPPFVRQSWETAKGFGRQFHDATELGKYVNASGPSTKKTS